MKYKVNVRDCRLTVLAKTTGRESYDATALDAFCRAYLRGFLKPHLVKNGVLEYSGPVGESLFDRLRKPVTKRDFYFIIEQLVVAVQKIWGNELLLNRLVLDVHMCFINSVTRELQFLYVPTAQELHNPGLRAFIDTIIYSAKPANEPDMEYISRFAHFMKNLNGFNAEAIENYINREDPTVVTTIKKQNAGQSGFITSKQKTYYEHYGNQQVAASVPVNSSAGNVNPEDDDPTGILGENMAYIGGSHLPETEETTFLQEECEDTTLLTEEPQAHYPRLVRDSTGETVVINKPVFRLGKERSYVDYFVADNSAVSRSHADIVTRSGRFYVIDLNSKNHTYINGQRLVVQSETEIKDGDRLKLANEDFTFYV